MCGFGGVINHLGVLQPEAVAKIAKSVSHRGPDSCGVRILDESLTDAPQGRHALFFNRLAIIDLDKRSDQPFEEDGRVLIFNGEIYNYKELQAELVKLGVQFHTTSDTEVLFHAIRIWGANALPKLNGMFAFFWLDKNSNQFLLARDRLGIKPVYYSQINNSFTFSSELDSIVRLSPNLPAISPEAVDMYLWLQYVPTPFSIFKGIEKLPPGHYIERKTDSNEPIKPKPFWDAYQFIQSAKRGRQEDLEEVLKNSLDRQLHADVPLGLFLSSGVDSSLLAALVNKYFANGNEVNFFTVQFQENTASDESADARKYIEGFNNPSLRCNTITINPDTVRDHLEGLYEYYDEPFADPAALLNWMISDKAREYVTVAISGDGADELFWGYHRYQRWQRFTRINSVPLLPDIARLAGQLLPARVSGNASFILERDPVKRHFNFFLPSGMRFKIHDPITRYPMWALDGVDKIKCREDLPSVLDIKTYLADAMLYKVDRSSMASSLEVRVPYLDNEVVDFALSLPLSEKSNETYHSKAPLKHLLAQLAPHYEMRNTKKGFSFPLRKWLKENWKDLVLSTINKNDLAAAGIDPTPYVKLVNDFYASRNDYFTDVWYIFNLALWMKKIKTLERN